MGSRDPLAPLDPLDRVVDLGFLAFLVERDHRVPKGTKGTPVFLDHQGLWVHKAYLASLDPRGSPANVA